MPVSPLISILSFLPPLLMLLFVAAVGFSAFYISKLRRYGRRMSFLRPFSWRGMRRSPVRTAALPYVSVSRVVEVFFPPFNARQRAEQMAGGDSGKAARIMEEWEMKRRREQQAAIMLKREIGSYFSHRPMQGSFHFSFAGRYTTVDTDISLAGEERLFAAFAWHHKLRPYRVASVIADTGLRLVGRVPFVFREQVCFALCDFKRNAHITDPDGRPVLRSADGAHATRGLEHLSDTPYWRHALKMNLYRFLIGKMEHIEIARMYLVDLSPGRKQYAVHNVPLMPQEVSTVCAYLEAHRDEFIGDSGSEGGQGGD